MRTPSSDDILRRSKGCLSRTLFLTPISSVNSVKPSSMCTPRVHSLPFQLHAGENKSTKSHRDGTKVGDVMVLQLLAEVALKVIWICCHELCAGMLMQGPEFLAVNVTRHFSEGINSAYCQEKENTSKSCYVEHLS